MFKSTRTPAEFLMVGDKIKLGGRPMIVVESKRSFYVGQQNIGVRSPNPSSDIKYFDLERKQKIKVYNAK